MANNTGHPVFGFENYTKNNLSKCQALEQFLDLQARESLPDFYITTAIAACMVNVLTCCSALILNAVVILAMWLTPSLRQEPKNVLLCSLAVSDFFVALTSQPAFIAAEVSLILGKTERYCVAVFIHFYTSWVFSGVSFLTLSVISIERYLALRYHLRYTELITTTRAVITVIICWLIWATSLTILWFGVRNRLISQVLIAVCILIAVADASCYFVIFKTVRRHNSQIKHLTLQDKEDIARYRRTTHTMVFLVCAFAASYVPFVITAGISASQHKEDMRTSAAHCMSVAFVSANSCVNPLIYFWRVTDFRETAKRTLRKCHVLKPANRVEAKFDTRL